MLSIILRIGIRRSTTGVIGISSGSGVGSGIGSGSSNTGIVGGRFTALA
jgi:hypothetical protein